jgi:succinoglycan biosynthesis transport protein ExoP
MTLQDYLRVLRERWRIVVAAVLIALIAAGATWFLRPAEYTAQLTLYVSSQAGDSTSSAFQGAQLSQQRVTSYVELVNSRRVSEDVIADLRLGVTPEALAKRITASSALDSVLIDVAVADRSPERAAEIANTLGTVFTALVDELERPVDRGAPQAVTVRVVQPAVAPAVPSSTGLAVTLALGLLAGLAVGIGGALARNALDTSVKSPEQLRELAKAPNLGTIAFDAGVPKRPLTVHEDAQSPRSEAFRQLRTNLQFVDVDEPRKVIVVTSALPAEGKTTTLANLAIALASTGQRVLAVEADLRRPKLADLLGLERSVGLTSVLSGRIGVMQAVQQWAGGVDVLASGPLPPNPSELLASQQMKSLLVELRSYYDTILIDTPPLLPVTDAAAVAPSTDGVILVCRFKETTRDQVTSSTEALTAVSASLLGTVLTMVPSSGPRAYAQYNSYYRSELPAPPASPAVGTPRVAAVDAQRPNGRSAAPIDRPARPSPRRIHGQR